MSYRWAAWVDHPQHKEVMPCPEECDNSWAVQGCAEIIEAPQTDGSCWRCGGKGFVPHDGSPDIGRTWLLDTRDGPTDTGATDG